MIHIYILKEPKTSKLDSSWLALYKIVRMFDNLNAEIGIRVNKIRIMHVNKLKLACVRLDSL